MFTKPNFQLFLLFQCPFDHWVYRGVSLLNLVSFVPCRFLSLAYIYYGMWTMAHRVPFVYLRLLFLSCCVMAVINCVLFWRLFKNDILKPYLQRSHSSASKTKPKVAAVNGKSDNVCNEQKSLTESEATHTQHSEVDSTTESSELSARLRFAHARSPFHDYTTSASNGVTVTSSICD